MMRAGPQPKESLSGVQMDTNIQPLEGSVCDIQTLYEGPPKCRCCKNWVDEYPDGLRMGLEQRPQAKQKALIIRIGKNHGDGDPLTLHSIAVQSPSLKNTLCEVFEGYDGITPSLNKVVFQAPFHPFFHRWARFCRILEKQKSEDCAAAEYTQLLFDVLNSHLGETMAEVEDLVRHSVITYPLLWALFEPGTCIVARDIDKECFFIVDHGEYNQEKGYFGILARFVDWDGHHLGYEKRLLAINAYSGARAIIGLNVFPASFHPAREEAEGQAIRRGQRFQQLCGLHHMAYSGTVKYRIGDRLIEKKCKPEVQGDGRIITDAVSYFAKQGKRGHFTPLESQPTLPQINVADEKHVDDAPAVRPPRGGRLRRTSMWIEHEMLSYEENRSSNPATDAAKPLLRGSDLLLCGRYVRGYSLNLKRWCEFEVEGVSDINWNDGAFSHLMLPPGYRDLVLSFVEGQAANKDAFDDFIEGKGLGVIMLFAGSPGTSKTLTAETVAEKVQKPLFVLSAGQLGHGMEVETMLKEALELAEKWNTILLLDECDVFLQERSMGHLEHNRIVAVFLRLLEYYRGTLIMTTNRSDTIDNAFQSRIDLTLQYPELDASSKKDIWRRFIPRSNPEAILSDEDYDRLSRMSMNGRQIKNTAKISTILASRQKQRLGMDHLLIVLNASKGPGIEHLRI
ncbi:P-loop containing nucleoside triphosphate hydrolase protein [Aspergillus spinulosporus]